MFLRNAWYVAALDQELGAKPLAVKILAEDIVLFRQADGTPAALEDACPHRKLPLSMGRIQGDHLECGYHGLTFDGGGRCVKAPCHDGIPPSAVVRSYPLVARYGILWLWMGEADRADPATIIEVRNWGDSAWGLNQGDAMTVDCNYLYVTDNLLDPSHVTWVHQGSFAGAACDETALNVSVDPSGVTVWRWIPNEAPAPFYAPFLKFSGKADRKQWYEVRFPSLAHIRAIFTPAGAGGEGKALPPESFVMHSYNFMTPIDENTTRYYWFQMRNFAPGDAEVSRQFAESVRAAFAEDRAVLAAVHKGMAHRRTPNIGLRIDAGPMQFRRQLARLIEAEVQATSPGKAVKLAPTT